MHDGRPRWQGASSVHGKPGLRRSIGTWLFLSVGALAFALSGCGGGGKHPGDESAPAAFCSGADSSVAVHAIYVAAQGTDDSGCGTTTATACMTLQRGIDNCPASGCAVFVRHGLYATGPTIRLRDGVSVYGGCRFHGEPDRRYRTVVEPKPAAGMPAVSADGVNSQTAFDGIVVVGTVEAAGGTASIAMAVSNSKGLALTRSVIVAGQGGDGVPVGPSTAATAQNGGGGDSSSFTSGGPGPGGPSCDAGGGDGRGGDGSARRENALSSCGDFSCDCNESGGLIGSVGGDSGWVSGGTGGGSGTQGNACYEFPVIRQGAGGQGATGGAGFAGACSSQPGVASADAWGTVQGTAWLPGAGGAGGSGDVGSGGGGGGPGGMCTLLTSDTNAWFPYWGLPGGGGGAGGCAGPGAPGGQQGGASIGLMLVSSSMAPGAGPMAIVAGPGGSGGPGGPGGIGGQGGAGGPGGSSDGNCTLYDANVNIGWGGPGGPGGNGGSGGAGSGGSGGNGGPSIGIALVGGSPAPDGGRVYSGFAGAGAGGGTGGRGGADDCTGATGEHGVPGGVAAVFDAAHPPRP